MKFIKSNYVPRSSHDIEKDYSAILKIEVQENTNLLEDMMRGRFKSSLVGIDYMTGDYKDPTYSQNDKHTLLNPHKSFTKVSEGQSSGVVVSNKSFANFDDIGDSTNTDMIQNRNSFFADIKKFKTIIQVYGKVEYTVGQIIELEVPPSTIRTEQKIETITSGKYLLTALRHFITRTGHLCSMELVKNSLMKGVER